MLKSMQRSAKRTVQQTRLAKRRGEVCTIAVAKGQLLLMLATINPAMKMKFL